MNCLKKINLIVFILFAFAFSAIATHNRAGEITYEQIAPLTFRVTVTTYTKTSSAQADRDSLEFVWGDGTSEFVQRSVEIPLPNDIKKNQYIREHTYPGRATYFISMTDPNRNGNVLNVNPPNSDAIPFHLETRLVILNFQAQGANQSPQLLQPPIDRGCKGEIFMHNANAFDAEGDSIAYELIIPRQDINTPVINYLYPNQILPGANNQISLDPITGDFVWNAPQRAGEYNIAFFVKEYRRGQLISEIIRDMQILIEECDNRPPTIETKTKICVIAGDTLRFDVTADDPDNGQLVALTGTGGPLVATPSPANFIVPQGYQTPPVVGEFVWNTDCQHLRTQFYQMVFKAEDNYFNGTSGLVALKTVQIKVVAAPPKNITAEVLSGSVRITWDKPYRCETMSRFRGFTIWRKEGCDPFPTDTCTTGLAGRGYTMLAEAVTANAGGRYFYDDLTTVRGREYSYRVVAEFTELNSSGQVFSLIESIPSDEACVRLLNDIPLIINVDVKTTDPNTGQIFVRWVRPKSSELDTLQNPGPYRYDLYRAPNFTGGSFTRIFSVTKPTFWQAIDTSFTDINLNTTAQPYRYHVAFWVNGTDSLGITENSSSIYLTVSSTDLTNILTWDENVAWTNNSYNVYRKNDITGDFDYLNTTTTPTYRDENLVNGKNYCYKIESIGAYSISGTPASLRNFSQEACGIPLDSIPPCPPNLRASNQCPNINNNTPEASLFNTLSWEASPDSCGNDVAKYNIYYSPTQNGSYSLIGTIDDDNTTTIYQFIHDNAGKIAGCYYIRAIDSIEVNGGGNIGLPSNVVCLDNCPVYELPNVFTPNADNINDTYTPFLPYRYISRIDIKIYNRWGELVHQNTNPLISWNGTDLDGKELAEGVYYYTCEVWESRLSGEVKREQPLKGFIQLIRGK